MSTTRTSPSVTGGRPPVRSVQRPPSGIADRACHRGRQQREPGLQRAQPAQRLQLQRDEHGAGELRDGDGGDDPEHQPERRTRRRPTCRSADAPCAARGGDSHRAAPPRRRRPRPSAAPTSCPPAPNPSRMAINPVATSASPIVSNGRARDMSLDRIVRELGSFPTRPRRLRTARRSGSAPASSPPRAPSLRAAERSAVRA